MAAHTHARLGSSLSIGERFIVPNRLALWERYRSHTTAFRPIYARAAMI